MCPGFAAWMKVKSGATSRSEFNVDNRISNGNDLQKEIESQPGSRQKYFPDRRVSGRVRIAENR